MIREKMSSGLDFSNLDVITADEQTQLTKWYEAFHGEGNLELSSFVPFWLELDPAELKRYRRWVEADRGDDVGIPVVAGALLALHTYVVIGHSKGALYEIVAARAWGATKAQVMETLALAWIQAGAHGMTACADRCLDYLRDWDETVDSASGDGADWPVGWRSDDTALRSGIDLGTPGLSADEIEKLESWYRTHYGEVPASVRLQIAHEPDGMKAVRGRYEGAYRGALPCQMIPLLQFQTAAYLGRPDAMRRSAHQARHFGVTQAEMRSVALSRPLTGELRDDAVAEAMIRILENWSA